MGFYLPGAGTLGSAVCPGTGIARSQGIPPDFCLPPVNEGLPVPVPLLQPLRAPPHLLAFLPIPEPSPLLLVWTNVASLNPWLSDLHTVLFSDGFGCYLF